MRKVEIELFTLDELQPNARAKAIKDRRWYITDDSEWWLPVYNSAEQVGLRIDKFDFVSNWIDICFINKPTDTQRELRASYHKSHILYILSEAYIKEFRIVRSQDTGGIGRDKVLYDHLSDQYLTGLALAYLVELEKLHTQLTSDDVIAAAIIENNVEFTKDGDAY